MKVATAIRTVLKHSFGRYVLVGGGVYLFELLVIFVAQQLGANALVAVSCGFWVGLVTSFTLQKFVTFGDKRTHHRILLPQAAAVIVLVLFNFGFTLVATKLLSDILPVIVIRTVTLGITTIWNFYLYKTRIFKLAEGTTY